MGTYNNWLRRKLADRIRSNGGYCRANNDDYSLAWMVRVYDLRVDTDMEDAIEALIEQEIVISEADLRLRVPDFEEKFKEITGVWEYAIERLQDDLDDDEGMRMWSPETAKRYGFDYKGEGAEFPFSMEMMPVSSGGKRVALVAFDGENLMCNGSTLADGIDPDVGRDYRWDRIYTNQWCRKLMGIMDELNQTLTEENAERCGRYYATDYIARELGLFD